MNFSNFEVLQKFFYAAHMTKPAQASLGEQSKHTEYFCWCQNVFVWDTIMPGDAQDPSRTTQVEGIKSAFLAEIQDPCFAAIEQRAGHTGFIDLHFGVDGQHGVVPDPSGQTGPLPLLPCRSLSSAQRLTIRPQTQSIKQCGNHTKVFGLVSV